MSDESPDTIDPVLALAEASLGAITSLLALVPLQVDQTNLDHARAMSTLQASVNQIAHVAMALGSEAVKPQSSPAPSSGIILPK